MLATPPIAKSCRGLDELTRRLDESVCRSCNEEVTEGVQDALSDVIKTGGLSLADELLEPSADGYARRLVYVSEDHGYVVIAMIWGPGQGTALHDHSGVWCVEGVIQGEIAVTQYQPLEWTHDGRWRFEPSKTVRAGVGSSGSLIPPFEYHTIANALDGGDCAVTLHVYAQELERANIFQPLDGQPGWYQRTTKELGYSH
ncbi:MAG: cysteine dioxygenase family protein [Thermoanaerobaculia bacterium]|nr:cysteine dioxygenase family protein [Thermoanaerobaculia bacterium]